MTASFSREQPFLQKYSCKLTVTTGCWKNFFTKYIAPIQLSPKDRSQRVHDQDNNHDMNEMITNFFVLPLICFFKMFYEPFLVAH